MIARQIRYALLAFSLLSAEVVCAQEYPSRSVTIVVPYAPGGSSDLTARILAKTLTDQLKQNFVVENKAGASGLLGAQSVAAAKPDGYTLLYAGPALAVSSFMTPNAAVNVLTDISPISIVTSSPYVLLVNPKVPAKTVQEFIAWAKERPGNFSVGISGYGSSDQIGSEIFDKQAGIKPVIIPYAGGGPMTVAAVSGEVHAVLEPASAAKPYMDAGSLRALGISSLEPSEILPDLPTIASQGMPGYQLAVWYGLWAPKQTPKELINRLHQAVEKALVDPDLMATMKKTGTSIKASKNPEEFGAFFKAEYDRYGVIVKELNLKSP